MCADCVRMLGKCAFMRKLKYVEKLAFRAPNLRYFNARFAPILTARSVG